MNQYAHSSDNVTTPAVSPPQTEIKQLLIIINQLQHDVKKLRTKVNQLEHRLSSAEQALRNSQQT